MSCLFEPIHGRFPTNSICDSYPDCVGCNYSDPFKQPKQTNADRIRGKDDEGLAEFIYSEMFLIPWCDMDCGNVEEPPCRQCVLKWLKQEAGT